MRFRDRGAVMSCGAQVHPTYRGAEALKAMGSGTCRILASLGLEQKLFAQLQGYLHWRWEPQNLSGGWALNYKEEQRYLLTKQSLREALSLLPALLWWRLVGTTVKAHSFPFSTALRLHCLLHSLLSVLTKPCFIACFTDACRGVSA
eukprot:5328090-Amphidinium_carterae.3